MEEYIPINEEKCKKLFDNHELRRLQKAAKDKNAEKLFEWGEQFEEQMKQSYERAYQEEMKLSIDNLLVAIAFALHFNENTKFGKKRLNDFMDDLMVTINMYSTGEYKPEEYKKMLEKEGLDLFKKEEK